MESCSICCFPYSEQENSESKRSKKILCCSHSLCQSCYLRLEKTHCPFCRSNFQYSTEDLNKRKLLNLDYYKWQPPSQITNYIPSETNRMRRINNVSDIINLPTQTNFQIIHEPNSRIRKNMQRRRRRDLSFEEVVERRKMIRKRCQMKWMKKNGRLEKELASNNDVEIF